MTAKQDSRRGCYTCPTYRPIPRLCYVIQHSNSQRQSPSTYIYLLHYATFQSTGPKSIDLYIFVTLCNTPIHKGKVPWPAYIFVTLWEWPLMYRLLHKLIPTTDCYVTFVNESFWTSSYMMHNWFSVQPAWDFFSQTFFFPNLKCFLACQNKTIDKRLVHVFIHSLFHVPVHFLITVTSTESVNDVVWSQVNMHRHGTKL